MTRLASTRPLGHAAIAALALLAGCSSSKTHHVQFAKRWLDVPGDWNPTQEFRRGVAISTWSPELSDNDRKESITVTRTELAPLIAQGGLAAIAPLLAAAQLSLQDAKPSQV